MTGPRGEGPSRPKFRRLLAHRGGHAAVELALVSPVLFMFLLGIMETGRALWVQNALAYAVSEAARCASNDTSVCGSTTQTQSFASSRSGYTFDSGVFTASLQGCGNQVSATYPMTLSIPYVPVSVTLTAQACYPS
jgi:hypothetical protein